MHKSKRGGALITCNRHTHALKDSIRTIPHSIQSVHGAQIKILSSTYSTNTTHSLSLAVHIAPNIEVHSYHTDKHTNKNSTLACAIRPNKNLQRLIWIRVCLQHQKLQHVEFSICRGNESGRSSGLYRQHQYAVINAYIHSSKAHKVMVNT